MPLSRPLCLALALAAAPAVAAPAAPSAIAAADVVAGRVLLKLKAGERRLDVARRTGTELSLVRETLLGWSLYDVTSAADGTALDAAATLRAIAALDADPGVQNASPERWYRPLAVPTDPGYPSMWHLEAIGAEAGWDHTTGLGNQRVGVVDTGTLRQHEELSAKVVAGYDFIENAQAAADGDGRDGDYEDPGDAANCGGGDQPSSWHGSHVAGTILGSTLNGVGIAGINWAAGLVTARALGKCGGSLVDIMEGAAWMVGANIEGVPPLAVADRVSVMNLSLGGAGPCSSFEQQVMDFIDEQGVIVVAASGNDGGEVGSPANCGNVITVAASGPSGGLTDYSSFGTTVEVVAPGGQMWSSQEQGVLSLAGPGNDAYQWQQGTSMAAPHVTGAVSLLQALNPDLSRYEVVEILTATGVSCAGCQGKPALRLDAALDYLATGELPPPPPDDSFAGNTSPELAAPVVCGQSYELLMVPGGEDWFSLVAEAGLLVTADVVASGDFDLDLYVHTAGGTEELGSSTSPTGVESVLVGAPGQPLHIAVLSFDGAHGAYGLSVACEDLDDAFEPNDGPSAATPLACYTSAELFMAPGDRDWFVLDVLPGEPFDLDIAAQGDFDLDLYVTTGGTFDDVVAESTSPTGEERVTFTATEQALYAVVMPFRDAAGTYSLSFTCPDRQPPEPVEPVEPEVPGDGDGDDGETPPPDDLTPQRPIDLLGGCNHTSGDPDPGSSLRVAGVLVGLLALFQVGLLSFGLIRPRRRAVALASRG